MDDIEAVARFIAAKKMGLIKDTEGVRLPDEFWHRYRDKASALLAGSGREECFDLVDMLVQPA